MIAAVFLVLLFWVIVGLFRINKSCMAFCTAIGTTWSAWVASRKALVQEAASPPATKPQEPEAKKDGGANHG